MKFLFFLFFILNVFADTTYLENAVIGNVTEINSDLILQLNSTTQGSLFAPTMTTAQKTAMLAPPSGATVFDSDLSAFSFFDGTDWVLFGKDIEEFVPLKNYKRNELILRNRDFYIATTDFTAGPTFDPELANANFVNFSPTDSVGGVAVAPTITNIPPRRVNIGSGVGMLIDPFTVPGQRTYTRVDFPASFVDVPAGNPNVVFFVRILANGTSELVLGRPAKTNYENDIIVAIGSTDAVGNIFQTNQHGWISGNTDSKIQDELFFQGVQNVSGNKFSPLPLTLSMVKTAGEIYSIGSNPASTRNPNNITTSGRNPAEFFWTDPNDINVGNVARTTIDPTKYNPNGGALTTVGNNKWTIQRIYMSAYGAVLIQFGQTEYNSYTEAFANAKSESFLVNSILAEPDMFIWCGYIIVLKEATNLDSIATGAVFNCGRAGCEGSGAGQAGAVNGDFFGPSTSSDMAIVRFDGTTGKLGQGSGVLIADTTNDITGPQNLTVSGTAIPTLRANGNIDNQQAGTLFLSQGDNFGFKIYYDATNTFDGLIFRERRNAVETNRLGIENGGQVQIGTVPNVTNVGMARLEITGPGGGDAAGPYLNFNVDGNNFPTRALMSFGHDNIVDCFDCYWDNAYRTGAATSAFRLMKTATDLIFSGMSAPTAGGAAVFSNYFWLNETGPAYFSKQTDNTGTAPYTQVGGTIYLNGPRGTQGMLRGLSAPGGNNDAASEMWNQNGGWGWQRAWIVNTASPPSVSFNGNITANSYANNSDRQLKKDISEIPKSILDKFKDLKPVQFKWKDKPYLNRKPGDKLTDAEKETKIHFGIIAQDLESIFPNMISEGEKSIIEIGDKEPRSIKIKSYDLSDMLGLAIAKIKQLEERIKILEAKKGGN